MSSTVVASLEAGGDGEPDSSDGEDHLAPPLHQLVTHVNEVVDSHIIDNTENYNPRLPIYASRFYGLVATYSLNIFTEQ